MAKTLVVYFSHKGENYMPGGTQVLEKGNTEYAAEFIQEALGADLFEIDTVKAYSTHYRECCKEAASEAKTNARPEIKDYLPSLEGYDTLFVCYPNWCGTAPMCIFTFLEHYDLTGKKFFPCVQTKAAAWQTPSRICKSSASAPMCSPVCPFWDIRSGIAKKLSPTGQKIPSNYQKIPMTYGHRDFYCRFHAKKLGCSGRPAKSFRSAALIR